jgi:lipopolysaccharide/colanic/teichoic acid biosynthesis glycosyltransferase
MRTVGNAEGLRQDHGQSVVQVHPSFLTLRSVSNAVAQRRARARERQRRWINVVLSALLLVLTLPLFLVIAALIKLTSRGPVFYTQVRVGKNRRKYEDGPTNHRRHVDYGGRLFRIYKFRTMRVTDSEARQVWASPDDPRVTQVGRVLRKYRLDELPQLFNVLKGDMNLVGPRPEQPEISVDLRRQIEEYWDRHEVLPGITGWAQVNLHYDMSADDVRRKLVLDLEYIRRRSPLEDLKIVARTVPVVLFQRGAW